jgi:hypothetical protein
MFNHMTAAQTAAFVCITWLVLSLWTHVCH